MRLILFAALLLIGACSRQQQSVFIDPALATLVPSDTIFLAGIRLEPLKKTPVWQQIEKQNVVPFERLRTQSGLDAQNDVWELLFAANGKSQVVLARGKFADHGLEPKPAREGFRRQAHKGYTILGDDRTGVAFLNSSTAAAGPLTDVKALIDGRDQGHGGIPKALSAAVEAVPRASQIWFAGMGMPGSTMNPNLRQFERQVQTMWGGADFTSGIDAQVIGESATPADAKKLHDALRALAGFARLSIRSEQKDLLRLLDSLNIGVNDRRVEVKLAAPADLTDTLLKMAPSLDGSRRRDN